MKKIEYKSGRKLDNLLARFVRLDKDTTYLNNNINNEYDNDDSENQIIVTRQTTINSETENTMEMFSEQPVNIICDNSSFKNIDFDVYLKCFIHELRTPLSIISLGMNLLENTCKSSQKKTINDVYDIIKYIENIFTKFSVIQDGNIALNTFEPFHIQHLIKNIESILHYNMLKHNIRFEYSICDKIYPWIYGDVHNIQHVLINIINNAIKYSVPSRENIITVKVLMSEYNISEKSKTTSPPNSSFVPKSEATFRVSSEEASVPYSPLPNLNVSGKLSISQKGIVNKKQQIIFSICDTNDYILPHIKQHLFETFNSTSGSGLGLYICKQIIELHGGTISHDYISDLPNILNSISPISRNMACNSEPSRHNSLNNLLPDSSMSQTSLPSELSHSNESILLSCNDASTTLASPTTASSPNATVLRTSTLGSNIGNNFYFQLDVDLCEDEKLQINSQLNLCENTSINNKSEISNSSTPSIFSAHDSSNMNFKNSNISDIQKTMEANILPPIQNVIVRRKSFTHIEENQDFSNISKDKTCYNIMIVDDSILNRKMMYKILKQIPIIHEVFTAVDGLDAINKICNNMNSIDIILIDKYMPQIDGKMVTKLLRGINYNKLIFEITGMNSNNDADIYDKYSANYTFMKPFDKQKINQLVEFIQKNGVLIQLNKKIVLVNSKLTWI